MKNKENNKNLNSKTQPIAKKRRKKIKNIPK